MEGVCEDVIKTYFEKAGDITFSKTANRRIVGKLNNTVREVEFLEEYLDKESKLQRYISIVLGRMIQSDGKDNYLYPIDHMLFCLGKVYGLGDDATPEDILDVDLYQLNIQMNLGNHHIWRRVLVPATYSFRHLHNIIQTVFDWQNYHLHHFMIQRDGEKPIMIVMDDDPELLEYIDPEKFDVRQERFLSLEEIFPKYNEVMYEYDFGDSWEHFIKLEKIVKSTEFRATYIEGEGKRPPEDVGGEGGFEEYLRVIADPNDTMHEEMKVWAEEQVERDISTELMNKWLERVLSGGRHTPKVIFDRD